MTQGFEQFLLHDFLLGALEDMRISTPTAVQLEAIPAILQGRDVIGRSQTGTGKTLAYLLPVIQRIDSVKQELQALFLAPTRELNLQIAGTVEQLTAGTSIDLVVIQGGTDINRQVQRLKRGPHIIVGTPGRVLDLINKEKLTSHTARYLVIDEADMMLEMGFKEDIEQIVQKMKKDTQIMLFAATLSHKVAAMAKNFLNQPVYIEVDPEDKTVPAIENVFFKTRVGGKQETLLKLIKLYNPYLGIVFVRKKEQVNELVTLLRQAGFRAEDLHGDMQRGQRKQAVQRFREARSQLLIATDIASRGLDIEGITHIFNYDLPVSADQYIHRIGRTGRADSSGIAINLISVGEEEKLRHIEAKIGRPFTEKSITPGGIADRAARRKETVEPSDKPGQKPKPKQKAPKKRLTGPNAKKKAIKEAQKRVGLLKKTAKAQSGKKPTKKTGRKTGNT